MIELIIRNVTLVLLVAVINIFRTTMSILLFSVNVSK